MHIKLRMGYFEHSTLALLFLVLGFLGFWYYYTYERPITNFPSSNETIVAFGDSLVVGVGSKQKGGFVSELENRLNIDIVNLGVSGNTTNDGWKRINQLTALEPKVAIISLGGNDFIRRKKQVDASENLSRIVSSVHRTGGTVILLAVPGYRNLHRDVAREHQTAYVPNILSGMLGDEDVMFDSIHPNDVGYAIVADRIEPVLRNLLRE